MTPGSTGGVPGIKNTLTKVDKLEIEFIFSIALLLPKVADKGAVSRTNYRTYKAKRTTENELMSARSNTESTAHLRETRQSGHRNTERPLGWGARWT